MECSGSQSVFLRVGKMVYGQSLWRGLFFSCLQNVFFFPSGFNLAVLAMEELVDGVNKNKDFDFWFSGLQILIILIISQECPHLYHVI